MPPKSPPADVADAAPAVAESPAVAASSAVAIVAVSDPLAVPEPERFRIGPYKKSYNYRRVAAGLFECQKPANGVELPSPDVTLYLLKDQDVWCAVHAQRGCTELNEVLSTGTPVFGSRESILEEGEHTWNWWKDGAWQDDWEKLQMRFWTTHL